MSGGGSLTVSAINIPRKSDIGEHKLMDLVVATAVQSALPYDLQHQAGAICLTRLLGSSLERGLCVLLAEPQGLSLHPPLVDRRRRLQTASSLLLKSSSNLACTMICRSC